LYRDPISIHDGKIHSSLSKSNQTDLHLSNGSGYSLVAIQRVLLDFTGHTLRAIFINWVEKLKWIALNEDHGYRSPTQWQV
jgi:hypothetical protein